jgi:hypothetical protein
MAPADSGTFMVPEHGHGANVVAKRIREVAMNRGFVLVRLEFSTIDRSSGFGVGRERTPGYEVWRLDGREVVVGIALTAIFGQ